MTKQSYQIIIYKKNLFIYLVWSRSRFLTKITAPTKYGGSTAPGSGSETLILTLYNIDDEQTRIRIVFKTKCIVAHLLYE